MKSFSRYCILVSIFFYSGCALHFKTRHGSTNSETSLISNGQSIEEVAKILGQESLVSNNSEAVYYINSDARHAYFLRPSTINYQIMKIDFNNRKVSRVTNYSYTSKYNSKFFKKLKSQDKIKIEDFFKEAIGTSSIKPS